jgi:flavin reductase
MTQTAAIGIGADDDVGRRSRFLGQMRRVPGAVAIIATGIGDDRTGLVATAWNSLCADPPMLLACVNRKASAYPLVQRSRAFSVNLLATSHSETVAIFSAQRGLEGSARFLDGDWLTGPLGQPMLRQAIASFECTLEGAHDYGTHTILIGRVGDMHSDNDAEAMLYLDGCFASAVRAL